MRYKAWQYTEEDIPKLKAGEREAVDRFYFGNYERIEALAFGYQRYQHDRHGSGGAYDPEDLMQNCYLDIPYYDYSSPEKLGRSIWNSFYWCYFGGDWYVRQNNRKIKNGEYQIFPLFIIDNRVDENEKLSEGVDDFSVIDMFVSSDDPHTEILAREEEERQSKIFDDLPGFLASILKPRFLDMWVLGSTAKPLRDALKKHANEVIEFLKAHGCTDHRLDQQVIFKTKEEEKQASQARKEYRKWQEEHLDELPKKERLSVLKRINIRNLRTPGYQRKWTRRHSDENNSVDATV